MNDEIWGFYSQSYFLVLSNHKSKSPAENSDGAFELMSDI